MARLAAAWRAYTEAWPSPRNTRAHSREVYSMEVASVWWFNALSDQ